MYIWVPIALSFRFLNLSSVLTTESRFYILKNMHSDEWPRLNLFFIVLEWIETKDFL